MREKGKVTIEEHLPTYDSVGDIDQALMLMDEAMVSTGMTRQEIEDWWMRPHSAFGDQTPAGAWRDSHRELFDHVLLSAQRKQIP